MAAGSIEVAANLGREEDRSGALPGTERSGLLLRELVNVERLVSGSWVVMEYAVPASLTPVSLGRRLEMEPWTHRPLCTAVLTPVVPLLDGDRLVRSDSSVWTLRGVPIQAAVGSYSVALVEAEAEDGLFATLPPEVP